MSNISTMTLEEFEVKFNEFDPLADHAPLTSEQARALAVKKAWLMRTKADWVMGAGVVQNVVGLYDRVPITAAFAEVATLRALVVELVEGLDKLAVVFALPGESSSERFERVALQFYKETGYVAPGKDCRLYSPEERQEVYDQWFESKAENARALIAKAKEQVK